MVHIKKLLFGEVFIVLAILFGALFIRSLHYSEAVNFSTDQATFATESLEIWEK